MRPVAVSSLSLRDLEYAVAVARERHFGRAAESCGVSQAALSEQVRKLESILGFPLFERTKRKVELTARGEAVVQQAEALLGDARRLLDDARRNAEPLTGELRLGAIATLGPYYLPAVIASGRRHFPRLALRLRESTTDALLLALRHGELDAILIALPVPPEGLRRAPLLLMEDGHCLRDQAVSLCDARPLPNQSRYASSLEMLRHMIAAGEGVSLIPELAAGEHTTMHGLLAYRELDEARAGRTIALVWRATETRAADLRAVASCLREELPAGVRPA
jgi:LysR family hydrogen peroxide-inducible transcriptional activator